MHTLTWRRHGRESTWSFADGLLDLTPHLGGQRAAVVASGTYAVLLSGDARTPLDPGGTTRLQTGEIEWHPPAVCTRPTVLAHEPTRGEANGPVPGDVELITPDGDRAQLSGRPVVIGRHPACDLQLDDPRVSTVHCTLHRVAVGVRVLDLQSTNGTLVNGARITSVVVGQRANIEVGGTCLRVRPALRAPQRVLLGSRAMCEIDTLIQRVATSDVPVLIEGESGVGKDGIARRVHDLSGRNGPFVPLNAAAISPTLAASELFGHVRGAFTGAEKDRDGAFLAADGGTLFLDEIAELPLTTQAELLRVVEQRKVRRLGASDEVDVDVRLVTATNRDLAELMRSGGFRPDLYHRICVVPVRIPPLRDRPDDLEQLTRHFLANLGRELSEEAWAELNEYAWPGNIRELHNVLQRACVLTDKRVLGVQHLLRRSARRLARPDHTRVMRAYRANQGNIAATARELGVHRSTVHRHLRAAAAVTEESPEIPAA